MPAVKGGKDPWLRRVEVDALYTLRACKQLSLVVELALARLIMLTVGDSMCWRGQAVDSLTIVFFPRQESIYLDV